MVKLNWKKVGESLLDILFPRFCFGCGREGAYICKDCEVFLTENNFICPLCGEASYCGRTHSSCGAGVDIDGLVSIWDYEGAIKKAIIDIKAADHFYVAEKLMERAFLIINRDQRRFEEFLNLLLVKRAAISFVPSNKGGKTKGLKMETKNHAKVIADELTKITDGPDPEKLLLKVRKTKKQSSLKRKERLKNVKGAFKASKDRLPKRVILVDDVFTTGATMRECAKTLKKQGVENVWGFALARKV